MEPILSLKHSDFSHANLHDVNLSKLILEGINLYCADLSHANLERTNLKYANLEGANLTGANLKGTNLEGASLRNTNLKDVIIDQNTIIDMPAKNHTFGKFESAVILCEKIADDDKKFKNKIGSFILDYIEGTLALNVLENSRIRKRMQKLW